MIKRVIWPALVYFALVFSAGFMLGVMRVLLIVPVVGERPAELLELPVMVLVSLLAARWIVRRFAIGAGVTNRLSVGFTALFLLLLAEAMLVLWVQQISLSEYVSSRDPVSGSAYAIALLLFALMPWFVDTRRSRKKEGTADQRAMSD